MRNQGFTLIEIVVVIAIIGFMAAVVSPNLFGPTASRERKNFIAKVNSLLFLGWQQALITHKPHAIDFDFYRKKVTLQILDNPNDKPVPVKIDYQETSLEWPALYEAKNFYIEGSDELSGKTAVYFYIMPDGMAQDVILNFLDTKDTLPGGDPRPIGLVLNPFSVQFKEYDEFQK